MNAGRLDRRISIQSRTVTRDDMGARVETWVSTREVWANFKQGASNESEQADAERVTDTAEFTVRAPITWAFHPQRHRIYYKSKTWNITGITEHGGRGNFLVLDCQSVQNVA